MFIFSISSNRNEGKLHFCHTSSSCFLFPSKLPLTFKLGCVSWNPAKTLSFVPNPFEQILFDGGLVADYLKKVKSFLDANPNEVITLLFTNPEDVSIQDVWKPAFDDSGACLPSQYSVFPHLTHNIHRDHSTCIRPPTPTDGPV